MGVVFKGGTSGRRDMDFSAPTPLKGVSQPVLMTETHGAVPGNIHLQAEKFRPHTPQTATPDFMPTGGAISIRNDDGTLSKPSTPDIMQQDTLSLGPDTGDESVFKGAPNTGTKGGPA